MNRPLLSPAYYALRESRSPQISCSALVKVPLGKYKSQSFALAFVEKLMTPGLDIASQN